MNDSCCILFVIWLVSEKNFFSNVTARGGYLGLLLQIQRLENQRSNIRSLERQLENSDRRSLEGTKTGRSCHQSRHSSAGIAVGSFPKQLTRLGDRASG